MIILTTFASSPSMPIVGIALALAVGFAFDKMAGN